MAKVEKYVEEGRDNTTRISLLQRYFTILGTKGFRIVVVVGFSTVFSQLKSYIV